MTIQEAIAAIATEVAEAIKAILKVIKDICDAIGEALRLWLVHEPKRKTTIGASMSRFKSWIRKMFQRRIRRKYNVLNERSDLYE